MSNEKDAKDVTTTSYTYDVMMGRWKKIDSLLGGTETMRAAGTDLLPQHEGESDKAYDERLNRCTLNNIFVQTLDSMVGRPFAEPVQPTVPTELEPLMDDVDLQGDDVGCFSRAVFRNGLAKGFTHVLVEYPRLTPNPDGTPRTLADDRAQGVRPYWCHVAPENVFYAYAQVIDGQEVLTHVRIREDVCVRVGFADVVVERIRVLEPGFGFIYEKQKDTVNGKEVWKLVEQYETTVPFIPLATFYAGTRDALMLCRPPLDDLADLNIAHWQSQADQTAVLTVARFPILAGSGVSVEDGGKVVVGPNVAMMSTDPAGRFYYVEHSGAAINAGRQDLVDLEQRMAAFGAQFLTKRPGSDTATARALDSAESSSPLEDAVTRFEDFLQVVLFYTTEWMGVTLPDDAGVEMAEIGATPPGDPADLQALGQARSTKDLSRESYLDELQRRGVLSPDFDADEDLKLIEAEAASKPKPMPPPAVSEEQNPNVASPGEVPSAE